MLLSRDTPDPFENYNFPPEGRFSGRYEYNYKACKPYAIDKPWGDKEWRVITRFDRFGGGKYRRSDYSVSVSWEDVERIIDALQAKSARQSRAAQVILSRRKFASWRSGWCNGCTRTSWPRSRRRIGSRR
jgi:hypothetical protein